MALQFVLAKQGRVERLPHWFVLSLVFPATAIRVVPFKVAPCQSLEC